MKKELPALRSSPKSEDVKKWADLFADGQLTPAYLREWFAPRITDYYSVDALGSVFRNMKVSDSLSTLADLLEEFIYNGEDVLQNAGKVTSQCGKGFKLGEPSYNCRECCVDHTCVMCAECFQKSEHRHHKYRMATSAGGGYCDCGDIEAWKRYPCCETHQPNTGSAPPIPSDMDERAKLVFAFVLDFSHEVINKFYNADIRTDGHDDDAQAQHLLLMYNDEVHTFDQVINLLVQLLACTPRRGLELASEINKEGRAVIFASDFDSCSTMKLQIERANIHTMLEAHVVPFQVVAHQRFVLNILLEWVQTILKTNQGFRSAVIEVLEDARDGLPLLDRILVSDTVRWKSARAQWNALLCSVFLPDNDSKKILAVHYLKNYNRIMENYLNDDEDHSFSVAGMSVQLFTVPSVAHELISRYGALKLIIEFIINMSTSDRNANGRVVFKRVFSRSFEKASYLLYDVRYLLCSPPKSAWPEQLRWKFIYGMGSFCDFLGFIEGMDAYTRQMGSHVEYEREWETAFNLQLKCFPVIANSLRWCASDDEALVKLFETATSKLASAQTEDIFLEARRFGPLGKTFAFTKFTTTENAVSIHLPLTRYWGTLCLAILSKDHLVKAIKKLPIEGLIDPVMRTRAMIAQYRAGMWRKNGHSTSSQVYCYHDTQFRAKTLDMDIIVLQIGAALMDSNDFLAKLAHRFGLLSFIEDGTTNDLPETDDKKLWALVDEFLHAVIILAAERFQVGIGKVTTSDCIKHELVHLLALEPMSHSELTKGYGRQTEDEPQLENVIKELTEFKISNDVTGKGQYELKDSYHPDFNVFSYHFTKETSFRTEQVKKAIYKKENGLDCCPPPDLPQFIEPLSRIVNLLNSEFMLHVVKLVLDVWLKGIGLGIDNQLHKIMILFGLALREEEKSEGTFMISAKSTDIVKLMLEVYCSGRLKEHKDLMKWVLQRYGSLVGDGSVEAAMHDYDARQEDSKRQSADRSRAEAARAKIMANMKVMQEQFSRKYLEKEASNQGVPSMEDDTREDLSQGKKEATDDNSSSQLGHSSHGFMTCILCQGEESLAIMGGKAMVYAAFVQLSTVHMRTRDPITPEDVRELILTSKMGPSPCMKTCGHAMHAHCWEVWQLDLLRSRAAGPSHNRPLSHDPAKLEFLCPLCQCISNVLIPIIPSDLLDSAFKTEVFHDRSLNLTFSKWLEIAVKLLCTVGGRGMFNSDSTHDDSTSAATLPSTSHHKNHSTVPPHEHCSVNLEIVEDSWIMNIKPYTDSSLFETEAYIMEIPTEKLNWVHAMASKVSDVVFICSLGPHTPLLMLWKTLAYTIHSFEAAVSQTGSEPLQLNPRDDACLENLVASSYALCQNKTCAVSRLSATDWAQRLLKMVVRNDEDSKCLLEWDCFGVLVPLILASPTFVTCHENLSSFENFVLQLMLISRMAQILLTMDADKYITEERKLTSDKKCLPFLVTVLRHKFLLLDADRVWEDLKKDVIPFLRCCLILFYYKNPSKYRKQGGEFNLLENDYEALMRHLGLPVSCQELLDETLTVSLIMAWAEHPKVRDFHKDSPTGWKFEPYIKEIGTRRINKLIRLPQDYSELLNQVRDFSCSNADINDSQYPTMCLICGKILCSLSYCCQRELNKKKVGSCTHHAHECGGGVGIFLRIRECQLLILAGLKGCYRTPPYFDEHHEPDPGLKRGNKLLLCEKSYEQLENAWRNHSVYEMVARTIETSGVFGFNNWMFF